MIDQEKLLGNSFYEVYTTLTRDKTEFISFFNHCVKHNRALILKLLHGNQQVYLHMKLIHRTLP